MTQAATMANLIAKMSAMSNFSVYQSVSQSISAATYTAVNFQSVLFDDLTEFSTSTMRFTAQQAGTYEFAAGVHGSTASPGNRAIDLYVNGVFRLRMQETIEASGSANFNLCGTSGPVKLAAGDYAQLMYYSAVADGLTNAQQYTYFSGKRTK